MDEFHDHEILAEIRAIRDARAKKFNYDHRAMLRDLRERQASWGREMISEPLKPANRAKGHTASARPPKQSDSAEESVPEHS